MTTTIPGTMTRDALRKLHQPANLNAIDAEIRRMYREGHNVHDVARFFGVSIGAVQQSLTRTV